MRRGVLKAGAVLAALAVTMSVTGACATAAPAAPDAVAAPAVGTAAFDGAVTQGNLPVDGALIHFTRSGTGPPLVLLHGWPQTSWTWHKVMPALSRTHTVIAFDLPGLGASSPIKNGFDKITTAKRIRQAVAQLGFGSVKVDIMAHDMGTAVAYRYARDFPAEVNRIAMLDTPLPGFGLEQILGLGWPFQLNSAPAPTPEKLIDNEDVRDYLGFVLTQGSWHPELVDMESAYKAYADPGVRHIGYEYTRAFAADAKANLDGADAHRLKLPVLVAFGQFGVETDVPSWYRKAADDVRGVSVPESGHFVPEENATFTADCATAFFGGPMAPGLPATCAA